MKRLDLRTLQAAVVGHVVLFDDGVDHDVRAVDGNVMDILRGATVDANSVGTDQAAAARTTVDRFRDNYRAVSLLVPSLTAEQVNSLLPEVVAKVIDFALTGVADVEETDPNGGAPAGNNSPA